MSKDRNYIGISTAIGGICGSIYGFRHPSENSCLNISKMKPTVIDTFREYRDSFDIKQAGQAVRSNKLTIDEFKTVNNIRTAIHNIYEKEQQIVDIANTPFEQRTKTYRQAVKEANAARPKFWKASLALSGEFKEKLIDLKIFNNERFLAAVDAYKSKLIPIYKELSKAAIKWFAVGIATGAAVGFMLNKIANKE